jgi:glycosyltransferase involved in cell wall biosynthesis
MVTVENLKIIPLLTIAIPTYNRAEILNTSLSKLLSQVSEYKNDIEIVISDNASDDGTQEVITKHKEKHPELTIITYLQSLNTGYFGNFKKCRELANGRYFWLLSDNEHISEGVIAFLIENIRSNSEVGAYFFDNILTHPKINRKGSFSIIKSNINEILKKQNAYRITLISAIVMLYDKTHDEFIMENYKDNSFLGVLFLGNALRRNRKIDVIVGNSFISVPTAVSFNIFKSWTKDIMDCVKYLADNKILDETSVNLFVTGFLKNVIKNHVYLYRIKGELHGKSYGSSGNLKNLLDNYYMEYNYYRNHIVPLFFFSKKILKTHYLTRKIFNRLRRYIFK